jgi:hypothetical protein
MLSSFDGIIVPLNFNDFHSFKWNQSDCGRGGTLSGSSGHAVSGWTPTGNTLLQLYFN